jgi:hypothetical protein
MDKSQYTMNLEELVGQLTLVLKAMATDEFADSVATMLWNVYSKSKEKGFSDEQAMSITLSFAKSQSK